MSAIFHHFGYPSPQLAKGLPAVASLPRTGSRDSSLLPTSTVTRPSHGSELVKAPRGGGLPQDTATTGPSTIATAAPPKMEAKRQKKKRTIPKCTVTSETIPSAEKKPQVFSESPDSKAEGHFRDSDRTISAPEDSPATLQ